MKKIKFLFMILAMAVSALASAQNITVTGQVKDSSTGEGIPFASLQVKGTMVGASTDLDGFYSISAPADGVLIFSSIGYVNAEVPVNGNAVVNVALDPDSQVLEETIVVAFGTATKESFTGSATVVKSDDIAKVQASDATRALEGVVAGVQMTTASGTLGSSPSIMIRGASSISAGTAPLYIVDGIPFSGDLNNLNPSDIESMTVLKDAASNALYGARGANGVIMITTKKAKHTDAVVNVDAKWGLNTKALKSYDYITEPGQYYEVYYSALKNYYVNSRGMSDYEAHILANQNITGPATDGGLGYQVYNVPDGEAFIGLNGKLNPNAVLGRAVDYNGQTYWLTPDNWMDETYRNSLRQEYNISVSGTTGNAQILTSFGYLNNKGIVDGSDMYRYTARLRADYQAKKWFKVGGNFSFTNYNYNNGNSDEGSSSSTGNIFAIANQIAPIYPLYIRDAMGRKMIDRYGFEMYDYGTGENAGAQRPYLANSNALQAAILDKNNSNGNAFNGSAYAEVKFLKDFTFTFNAGLGFQETRSSQVMNMYYGQYATMGGLIAKGHSRGISLNLQQLLNWSHTFGVHNVGVLLGHETYQTTSASLSASKSQMFSMDNDELAGAVVDGKTASSSRSEYNNEGFFVRAQYDYMNRIFASASFRRDGSSRFHKDHWWGNFWSLGGGWIINEETWFPRTPWIDMLKLKASIGSQGNDNIGMYMYTDLYSVTNDGNGGVSVIFGRKGNEKITWETNSNLNIGAEFGLWQDRLSGSVDFFYRKTTDMLFSVPVTPSMGYSSYYDNIGDMANTGIEVVLNGDVVRTPNVVWSLNANLTWVKNKVLSLPESRKDREVNGYHGFISGSTFLAEGLPLNTYYMPTYAGVDPETGESSWNWYRKNDDQGNPLEEPYWTTTTVYSNVSSDPDSWSLLQCSMAKVFGGFGTSLYAYGFDLSIAFDYQLGGYGYDGAYAGYMDSPTSATAGKNYHLDLMDAWTKENPTSQIPRFQLGDQYTVSTSDRFIISSDYLNISNINVGYNFPAKWWKGHIQNLRVYVACDNVWYWSKRKGYDPRGGSNSYYSPIRTISGGVTLTF